MDDRFKGQLDALLKNDNAAKILEKQKENDRAALTRKVEEEAYQLNLRIFYGFCKETCIPAVTEFSRYVSQYGWTVEAILQEETTNSYTYHSLDVGNKPALLRIVFFNGNKPTTYDASQHPRVEISIAPGHLRCRVWSTTQREGYRGADDDRGILGFKDLTKNDLHGELVKFMTRLTAQAG